MSADVAWASSVLTGVCRDENCDCGAGLMQLLDSDGDVIAVVELLPDQARELAASLREMADLAEARALRATGGLC